MSISQQRQRTFNAHQLDIACELENANIPVNRGTIDAVAQRLQQPRPEPAPDHYRTYEQVAAAAVEVIPRQIVSTPVHKYTHQTTSKVTSNRDIQLHQFRSDAVWVGIGVGCLIYYWTGSTHLVWLAVGGGTTAVGSISAILRFLLMWHSDKHDDNAVQMTEFKETTKQETQRQITERERIISAERVKLAQQQVVIEAERTQQAKLEYQRQQRQISTSQQQMEVRNRTVSETHMIARQQPTADYGGFDDVDIVDIPASTTLATVDTDNQVLSPDINDAKEALLDWLGRVYEGQAFNDRGALIPKNISGNGSAPWAQRGGYPKAIQSQIVEYIQSQRGGHDWLFQKHGNAYRLNTACFGSYEVIENHINVTWL